MTGNIATDARELLKAHPFLHGLHERFLEKVAAISSERTYETGDMLIREGDPAFEFLLVTKGKVALEIAAPGRPHITLFTIGPGEGLGWSWFLPPYRWRMDGRAVKKTHVIAIEASKLRTILEENPADALVFLRRFIGMISERLESTHMQMLEIYDR